MMPSTTPVVAVPLLLRDDPEAAMVTVGVGDAAPVAEAVGVGTVPPAGAAVNCSVGAGCSGCALEPGAATSIQDTTELSL